MTKSFGKAIMERFQLKTKYFKTNTAEILQLYKKRKNFCSNLYKKETKKYFSSLKLNIVTKSKAFWKTIKPLFFH